MSRRARRPSERRGRGPRKRRGPRLPRGDKDTTLLSSGTDYVLTSVVEHERIETVNVKTEDGSWVPADLRTVNHDARCCFCGAPVVHARTGTLAHVVHHKGPCDRSVQRDYRAFAGIY